MKESEPGNSYQLVQIPMSGICSLKVSDSLDLLCSNRCHGNIAREKHQNLLRLRRFKAEIRFKMKESTVNLP